MPNVADGNSTASILATHLQKAVAARTSASLIVSGGSSPLAIFAALRTMALPWSDITVSLVDDRLVDDTDSASNVALIKAHLLQDAAAKARFICLKTMDDTASQIAKPFDVMLLGMGTDGHFASLFADMPDPELAFDPDAPPSLLRIPPRGDPLCARVSMNLSMILASRHLYLIVAGAEKQAVLERAKSDTSLPIHHLLKQQRTELHIVQG